jgi:MFS family permease
MATAASAADVGAQRTTAYSWVVLTMLTIVYIFNFLDRQLMSILQEPIKEELGLTDAQLGRMTGLYFALVYTVLGVGAGFLADRWHRRNLLAAGCALWSAFTVACGMAQNYPQMLAARVGVGVGEAAGAPPSYSIISDYFPAHMRGLAMGIFSLGVPFGLALGAAFGGVIHETWGWRMAFVSIGIAGVVAAGILMLVVREPQRGKMDTGAARASVDAGERSGFMETVKDFFTNPVLFWTSIGCGLFAFVGYVATNWNVSFLVRVKGINFGEIALWYSLMIAVCAGAGTLLSGALVDWLSKRSKVWFGLLPAIAIGLSGPFWLAYVWAPTWQVSLMLLAVPTFLNIFYLAPALAVVQNTVKPSQRAMAGALLLLVNNLIGLGLGPTYVGELSSMFARTLGDAEGLRTAMYWAFPFYILGVLALLMEARALGRAEKTARAATADLQR